MSNIGRDQLAELSRLLFELEQTGLVQSACLPARVPGSIVFPAARELSEPVSADLLERFSAALHAWASPEPFCRSTRSFGSR